MLWYENTPDEVIQNKVIQTKEWRQAGNVHIYKSMKDEVATKELVNDAYYQSHKELFFPHSLPEGNPLDMDLVIVPGRLFDYECNRKGRGGGYYDKYLGLLNVCKLTIYIGLCYESQMVESLDVNEWDIGVDMVITEKNTWCRRVSKSVY
tara:strand:+ start:795 stop:1244 length:450 start_codon:yes stop_codon:yes gene_type:complete